MKIKVDIGEEKGTIPAKDIPPGRIAKVDDSLYLLRTVIISNELIRVWPASGEFESLNLNSSLSMIPVTLMPIGTKLTFES